MSRGFDYKKTKAYQKSRLYTASFLDFAQELNSNIEKSLLEKNQWSGFEGRVTRRQNGEVIRGSLRNIVDTGDLKNSQRMDIDTSESLQTVTYSFDSEHYKDVRFGQPGIPGRDFIRLALNKTTKNLTVKDYLKDDVG